MQYIAKITARIEAVLVCASAQSIASSRMEQIELNFEGIPGDNHYGYLGKANGRYPEYKRGTPIRNSRQVSIISTEEMQQVAEGLGIPAIQPEWLGANLYLSGLPALTLLPPSSRLFFESGAVLVVHGENDPCIGPGSLIQENYPGIKGLTSAFVKAAFHRRGLVAWVEKPGLARAGESVVAQIPEQFDYSAYLPHV
jgi:hypothetical protein